MKKWTKFQWLYLLPFSGLYRWKYESFPIMVEINNEYIQLHCYLKTCKYTNTHMQYISKKIGYGEWQIIGHSKYIALKHNKSVTAKTMSPIKTL